MVRAGYGVFYDAGMFIVGLVSFLQSASVHIECVLSISRRLADLAEPVPDQCRIYTAGISQRPQPQHHHSLPATMEFHHRRDPWEARHVTLSYVGSSGSHLIRERDLNQPELSPTGSQANLQSRRPYPAYSAIFDVESESSSNFNAMELRYTGHITPSISVWSAYT